MLKKDQWKLTFRVQKVIESEVRDLCKIFRDHNDPQHSFMFLLYSFSICQSIRSKRLFNQWRLLSIAFKRKIVWYLLFVFDISSQNTSVVKINQVILYCWNLGESWNKLWTKMKWKWTTAKWFYTRTITYLCSITPCLFYRINPVKNKSTFWLHSIHVTFWSFIWFWFTYFLWIIQKIFTDNRKMLSTAVANI